MDQLSQTDRIVIAKYPLNESLDHLREVLRKADEYFTLERASRDGTDAGVLERPRLLTALMGQLLAALMSHRVAYDFHPKTSRKDVSTELQNITKRVRVGDFDYENYRPLSRLVIDKAPDVDIWTAVLDLIASLSRLTPPASVAASFDSTPIARSTSSFQGNEQTKKLLEAGLFYEIQYCTYRNVKGFFAKFFERKKWSGQAEEIYNTVKKRHVGGRWVDFPDPPVQEDVSDWLSHFQDEHLSDAPGAYYTSKNTGDLTGAEAKRQLDIFVKQRSNVTSAKHDWRDVHVIGEHKQSQGDLKTLLLQLSRYMRDVFTAQPTRRLIHGFLLHGTTMELWVFDRSGPYSSGEFDINKEPEKFIRAIVGYALMDSKELGLDTFVKRDGKGSFVLIKADNTRKRRKIQLESDPIVRQRAIVCRGTTCYRSKDLKHVIKLSWTSDKRPPEADHLILARKNKVQGVARLLGHQRISSIAELRDGLVFPPRHRYREVVRNPPSFSQSQADTTLSQSFGPFQGLIISRSSCKRKESADQEAKHPKKSRGNSQISKLRDEHEREQASNEQTTSLLVPRDGQFDNRLFTCLAISPAGRPLSDFHTLVELLTALRDVIKAHRSLYFQGNILHRDISENNIIITEPKKAKGFTGMLIDLDLAKELGSGRSGARHQTGTMEFMAIQVLRKTAHTYRHDLESFFYVLLWICARRVWEREFECKLADRPERNILRKWYTGSYDDIADAKSGYMHADGFKAILQQLPPSLSCVKPLCRKIRTILFPLTREGELDIGTPNDPAKLYTSIEEAFEEAITSVAAEEA